MDFFFYFLSVIMINNSYWIVLILKRFNDNQFYVIIVKFGISFHNKFIVIHYRLKHEFIFSFLVYVLIFFILFEQLLIILYQVKQIVEVVVLFVVEIYHFFYFVAVSFLIQAPIFELIYIGLIIIYQTQGFKENLLLEYILLLNQVYFLAFESFSFFFYYQNFQLHSL